MSRPVTHSHPILYLQHRIGNRAVSAMLQSRQRDRGQSPQRSAQLQEPVGRAADPYEQPADDVVRQFAVGEAIKDLRAGEHTSSGTEAGIRGNASEAHPASIQRASFESQGHGVRAAGRTDKITRPKQVLSEYGMTCYGTSVMYMIQSYGLVPPDMTREEFEYAFTPLNPKDPKRSGDPKTDSIEVAGTAQPDAKPVDLVTEALQGTPRPSKSATSIGKLTVTEATLRGANWGGFTVANIMAYMPRLLAAFKAQSAKKGYEFMKTHLPASGTAYVAGADEKWIESSKELIAGTIGANYFKDGNTVMTGVDYSYPPGPSLGHWVVVVKEPEKEKVAGIDRFLYPADDPLFGQVYVMAPLLGKVSDKTLDDAHLSKTGSYLSYKGHRVHMFFNGQAYRRKVKTTP